MDDIEDSIFEGGHFMDDDGNEIDVDLIPIPLMCLSCMKFGMRGEEYVLCTLNRMARKPPSLAVIIRPHCDLSDPQRYG